MNIRPRPLLASFLVASLAFPAQVFAQPPPPPPPSGPPVQPVPYAASQPVQYPAAPPPGTLPVGNDVVYLKGGGLVRGTLVEAIPNDHASVELANGQSAVIPWDRVERIDRGGAAVPGPPPVFYSVPGSGGMRNPGPTASVHIEADAPVNLERREGRQWVFACAAPCDADMAISDTYRISGTDVRNTSAFRLNARPGDHVVLEVATAPSGNFKTGIALTGVGGGALLIGGMVLYFVAIFDWADDQNGEPHPSGDGTANTVGWVMVGAGAAALVVGIVLLSGNFHSKVEQAQGIPKPRNDAWLRLPTWHDDKSAAGVPKAMGIPLLEKSF